MKYYETVILVCKWSLAILMDHCKVFFAAICYYDKIL